MGIGSGTPVITAAVPAEGPGNREALCCREEGFLGAVGHFRFVKLYDTQVLVWHFSRFRSILCNSHGSCCFLVLAAKTTSQGWVGDHETGLIIMWTNLILLNVSCVYMYIYIKIPFPKAPNDSVEIPD